MSLIRGDSGGGTYTDADAIAALEAAANVNVTGTWRWMLGSSIRVDSSFRMTSTIPGLNKVFTSDASGTASWQVPRAINVSNAVAGSIIATDVQAAINELAAGRVNRTTVNFVASPYTALSTDQLISVDSTGGVVTINLPTAVIAGVGKKYIVKDAALQSAGNNITIDGSGADTIDLAATLVMASNGLSYTIVSDGLSNWEII